MSVNNFLLFITSPKFILSAFIIFLLAWLGTFHHRYIEADECILGEFSYSFLEHGYVKAKTIPLVSDWDVRMFAHHKLFTWYGALIITIVGWSITWLKISIIPWYGLFFYFLYRYLQLKGYDKRTFILAAFLVFTSPIVLLKSFSFRPDVILMTEGMALLYFLSYAIQKNKAVWGLAAGATAGLGFLTHLNGAAFCIAGFFFLLIKKEYKYVLPYIFAGVVVGGVYFIELMPEGNLEAFINQLKNWPTVNHGENFVGNGSIFSLLSGRVEKLLSEHQRFFWGDRVMGFSILFFLTLAFSFRYLMDSQKEVLLFLLLLVLSLNIFGSHVAERYLLFYYGPMAVITSSGFLYLVQRKRWHYYFALAGFVFHLTLSSNMLLKIYDRKYDAPKMNHFALSQITDSTSKILVPYEMIYNDFPERDLYVYKTYEYLGEDMANGKMTQLQLFEQANLLNMDYIVINEKLALDKGRWFFGWEVKDNPYYSQYYKDDDFLILRNNLLADSQ